MIYPLMIDLSIPTKKMKEKLSPWLPQLLFKKNYFAAVVFDTAAGGFKFVAGVL
jgi:hypothetical protein